MTFDICFEIHVVRSYYIEGRSEYFRNWRQILQIQEHEMS